jgi:hypothetical protein
MRIGLVAVISSLAVALALVLGFVVGYGPYTFYPRRLPSDVVAAMPAEKRAEWQTPHRIRGLDALREVSADPSMQAILGEVTIVLWLSGFLSVLGASRWLRR